MITSLVYSIFKQYFESPLRKLIEQRISDFTDIQKAEAAYEQYILKYPDETSRYHKLYSQINPVNDFETTLPPQSITQFKQVISSVVTDLFDSYFKQYNDTSSESKRLSLKYIENLEKINVVAKSEIPCSSLYSTANKIVEKEQKKNGYRLIIQCNKCNQQHISYYKKPMPSSFANIAEFYGLYDFYDTGCAYCNGNFKDWKGKLLFHNGESSICKVCTDCIKNFMRNQINQAVLFNSRPIFTCKCGSQLSNEEVSVINKIVLVGEQSSISTVLSQKKVKGELRSILCTNCGIVFQSKEIKDDALCSKCNSLKGN